MEQIIWVMYNLPRFLLHSPEYMKKFVNKVDEMGVSRDSRMFIHALRVVSTISYETWELKLKAFRKLGFSENDIVVAFRKAPFIFGSSEKKMKELIKVLLATGKYDMSCIIRNPTSFSRSIEKNFKPRLHVLQILESENLIQNWPSLSSLCTMSVKKFFERFVGPYLDKVGHVNYVYGEELLGAKKELCNASEVIFTVKSPTTVLQTAYNTVVFVAVSCFTLTTHKAYIYIVMLYW
ncbi:hypothetical protein ACJIZ3_019246 [Penstemon smallii]|uniref:Uncharacterized protein n=1 Tax=Penstemon smallii TaxID=265156 RepID=A0ABD3T0M4_9LAMI